MARQIGIFTVFFRALGTFFGKAFKSALITVVIVVAIIVSLLPFVVRWQAVHWLEQQGLKAEIGYISIRPILGSVQINDIRINRSNTEQLMVDELRLNINWNPLFDHRLYIEHMILEGLSIDVVSFESGMRIGGIALPNQEVESGSTSETDVQAGLHHILLEKLELKNIQLCYSQLGQGDTVNLRQCMAFGQLSSVDDIDVHLGEQTSVLVPGLELKGFHWSDQKETAELLSVGLLSISDVVSEDMQQWQVASMAVDDMRMLPVMVNDVVTDGDIQLKTLALSELNFGGESSIGSISLAGVVVKLQTDEKSKFTLVPDVIRRVDALFPSSEDKTSAEVSKDNKKFFLGDVSVKAVSVQDVAEDRQLLSLRDVGLQRLSIRGGDVGLDRLQLSGLTLLPSPLESAAILGDLHVDTLSVSDLAMGSTNQIGDISLKNIQVGLRATDNGQLAFAPKLLERFVQADHQVENEKKVNGHATALTAVPDQEDTGAGAAFSLSRLALDDAVVLDMTNNRNLLLMRHVDLLGLAAKGDDLSFGQLQLMDLKLLELQVANDLSVSHYFSAPKVMLSSVTKGAEQLKIGNILVEDPNAYLHRNTEGELQLLADINSMLGSTSKSDEADSSESQQSLAFTVGAIKVGPQGRVVVLDESVSPSFRQEYTGFNLTVDHVDSSSPDTKTMLSFDVGIDKFGHLTLAGNLTPFSEKLDTSINGELRGLDMRALSAYAGEYIGYSLDQGVVEADINFDVHEDDIDALVTTRFRKLEVSPLREDALPEGREALGVPLEFALGLLRDKNGMIELKLPVTGGIHSPDFSLKHIIGKVMFKVISETIVNYYLPFGLIMAATMQDTLSNLSFESIGFSPGGAELDTEARENLDKLSDMLNSRKQLHLSFCGPSTWQDWSIKFAPSEPSSSEAGSSEQGVLPDTEVPVTTAEQVASLKLLANQRSDAVKEYLINSGVESGQVILCEGRFDQTNKLPPQMNIAL